MTAVSSRAAPRPRARRASTWASAQSEPIASRAALEARVAEAAERLGVASGDGEVPRPPHWGGYRLLAEQVELWRSRPARIHDRALCSRQLPRDGTPGSWSVQRLQP